MRIITISRQFGSGGRRLGMLVAGQLGWDYYDKEIIEALAEEQGMDPDHVRHTLSHHGWQNIQLTYRNSFSHLGFDHAARTSLLLNQKRIIEEIAEAGNDCIIVGRDADVILQDYHPFRIFVCADLDSRIQRCMAYENKKPEEQRLSQKDIVRNIRRIDKNRNHTREILTGKRREDASMFDLTINGSRWEITALASAAAEFVLKWYDNVEMAGRKDVLER